MTQLVRSTLLANGSPRWVESSAERALAARGQRSRLKRLLDSSLVPMVILDGQRRYVEVNTPARLALRVPLSELRRLRVEDLTPRDRIPHVRSVWTRLLQTGAVTGPYSLVSPDGARLEIVYYALADVLPGLHLGAFAPAEWPEEELLSRFQRGGTDVAALTARELEVLELAADGRSAPLIATDLCISVATVRSHFGNIYEKLGVGDRAAAVATALRLGMIA